MERLKISLKQAKFIKSLMIKKFRHQERLFIVEGKKNVDELFHSNWEVRYLLGTDKYFETTNIPDAVSYESQYLTKESELVKLGSLKSNQDCLAVVAFADLKIENIDNHVFLLDGINDPGNLGTIIRTLDWFGFHSLVCSPNTTDHYSPKVVNTSKGSFFRMKILFTELSDFIKENPSHEVYRIEMSGRDISHVESIGEKPSIFVLGSESHGISEKVRALSNHSFTIPAYGQTESLNVGIATGILCYQLRA